MSCGRCIWAAVLTAVISGPATVLAADAVIVVQRSPLAGFRHTNAAGFWRDMKVGDRLDLVREPENPYDAGAIRVEWRGRKLGYVPRRENPAVARQLDRGAPLEARIISLRENRNRSVHIEFEVVARLSSR